MKKIILGSLLMSSILIGNITTLAETVTKTASSDANIELTAVDPEDKPPLVSEDPLPEENPTGQTGDFTIDLVPKFDFGQVSVAGGTVKLPSTNIQAVQVSDRRADKEGWVLKAQLSTFDNVDEAAEWKTLNGATINSSIIGSLLTTEGNINAEPIKSALTLEAGGEADILMETNSEVQGSGKGSWMGYFADGTAETETSLTVPAGNYAGNYKAVMTWTLSATQD